MRSVHLVLSLLLLGGCSVLPDTQPVEVPTRNYRLLSSDLAPVEREKQSQKVLLVSHINAQPGADTVGIAYRRKPTAISYYARSQWIDEPARMLLPEVVAELERQGRFRAVLSGSQAAVSDLRLDLELVELLHDFTVSPSQMRFELRALLIDQRTQQVLGSRRFSYREAAEIGSAEGGVAAANRNLSHLLRDLSAWLDSQLVQ